MEQTATRPMTVESKCGCKHIVNIPVEPALAVRYVIDWANCLCGACTLVVLYSGEVKP